jgi:serine/threonine protein kinase
MIGGFAIGERIARGLHATVHEAHAPHAPMHRLTAKVARPGEEARLHREAAALRSVSHRALIRCEALIDDGRHTALVLPRAEGSLSSLIGKLDESQVAAVVIEILEALASLHEAGTVHGDVRAPNVLLFADGAAVLADLDLAARATPAAREADVRAAARLGRTLLHASPDEGLDALLATAEAAGGDPRALASAARTTVPRLRPPRPELLGKLVNEPPTLDLAGA